MAGVCTSGVATIEATKAAASVKNAQLSEQAEQSWSFGTTQTLLDSITVPHTIVSITVVLSRARTHGDTVWHSLFSYLNL